MPKFALLFIGGTVPEDKREQNMKEWMDWFEELKTKVEVVDMGSPFGPNSKVVTSSGTKDYDWKKDSNVSGYSIIEATNVDEAAKLTESCPGIKPEYVDGIMEVRELMQM